MSNNPISRGLALVMLLVVLDRKFFQDLLADPEQALRRVQQRLDLTDDDVIEVTRVVQQGLEETTPAAALAMVDDLRAGRITPPPPPPWPILRPPLWPVRPPHDDSR